MLRVREGYERRGGSIIGIASRGQHHIEGQVGTAISRAAAMIAAMAAMAAKRQAPPPWRSWAFVPP
jgi:hypothetical protein